VPYKVRPFKEFIPVAFIVVFKAAKGRTASFNASVGCVKSNFLIFFAAGDLQLDR